jgi:hypothetical protein
MAERGSAYNDNVEQSSVAKPSSTVRPPSRACVHVYMHGVNLCAFAHAHALRTQEQVPFARLDLVELDGVPFEAVQAGHRQTKGQLAFGVRDEVRLLSAPSPTNVRGEIMHTCL